MHVGQRYIVGGNRRQQGALNHTLAHLILSIFFIARGSSGLERLEAVDSNVLTVSSRASAMPAIAPGTPTRLARAWLFLGVMALIGSGLLAVLLVLSRTPGIQDVFPLKDLFRAALVVHVDLSVAVWFMAFAAVIWCAVGTRQ